MGVDAVDTEVGHEGVAAIGREEHRMGMRPVLSRGVHAPAGVGEAFLWSEGSVRVEGKGREVAAVIMRREGEPAGGGDREVAGAGGGSRSG